MSVLAFLFLDKLGNSSVHLIKVISLRLKWKQMFVFVENDLDASLDFRGKIMIHQNMYFKPQELPMATLEYDMHFEGNPCHREAQVSCSLAPTKIGTMSEDQHYGQTHWPRNSHPTEPNH
jgi:hypothetical protein